MKQKNPVELDKSQFNKKINLEEVIGLTEAKSKFNDVTKVTQNNINAEEAKVMKAM
jgi:hypothetical protein